MAQKKRVQKTEESDKSEEVENKTSGASEIQDEFERYARKSAKAFRRSKTVAVPIRKIEDNQTVYVRIESPIEERSFVDPQTGEPQKMSLCKIFDLEDGTTSEIAVGKVLGNQLEEHYPENGYVGRNFEIKKIKIPNKRWKNWEIYELEVEEE